jgi:hypothetical protein
VPDSEARRELHAAWIAARNDASAAFLRWCDASRAAKREALAVYRAAADREEAAAFLLEQCGG